MTSPPLPGSVGEAAAEKAESEPAPTPSPPSEAPPSPPVSVGAAEAGRVAAPEHAPAVHAVQASGLGIPEAELEGGGRERRLLRGVHPAIPFLVAILLIVGVLVGLIVMKRKNPELDPPVAAGKPAAPPQEDGEARMKFLRDGWKAHSSQVLASFLRAATVEAKARLVIGGDERIEEMKAFYGEAEGIKEADTPVELFSHFDLDIADKKRGLFLMQYDRPRQVEMGEYFRPVAPLEVKHNLEPPGLLLSAYAARDNFTMDSMRVMAFFKEVGGELLLDWDVYVQTKYRTLRHFVTYPQAGSGKEFRVMVREEPPTVAGADLERARYFRFADPAHPQDHVVVPVAVNSLPGRILMDIAWVSRPGKQAQDRYATVQLGWSAGEEPRLSLRKVICWEFLGLGGVAGNADPVDDAPPADNPGELHIPGAAPAAPIPTAPPASGVETVGESVGVPGGESQGRPTLESEGEPGPGNVETP